MATDETYISGQLYLINLNELLPDPDQPRKYMDPAALTEMVDSVKEHGIIQPPTFRIDAGGLKYIVTGERRGTAARMAGLTEITKLPPGGAGRLPQRSGHAETRARRDSSEKTGAQHDNGLSKIQGRVESPEKDRDRRQDIGGAERLQRHGCSGTKDQ